MLKCHCPTCGAKHQKRKTTPVDLPTRNLDIVLFYLEGNNQIVTGQHFHLTKQAVKKIIDSPDMVKIVKELNDNVIKINEFKSRYQCLKKIEVAARNYTNLRLQQERLIYGEEVQVAFEQLLEVLK